MIPSKKWDRVATFQKIARVKSWVIEMEGESRGWPKQQVDFYIENPYTLI